MVQITRLVCLLSIFLSLNFSCKSSSVESNKTVENFFKQYLENIYSSEFELIDLRKSNAPGQEVDNYEAKFRSLSVDRRDFYVSATGNENLKVTRDQYPIILLEQAFLELLDIKGYKDFPVVFEIVEKVVTEEALDVIHSVEDAKTNISSFNDASWNFYIYTVVEDYKEKKFEVEDMIVNLLRQADKVLPARISANVYIYDDASLTEDDITPDMNVGVIKRTPHPTKLVEQWIMGWNTDMLNRYDNGFQSVVKKRRAIPK